MGGHVRSNWKDVTEIIAAQLLYTIKKYGPDANRRIYTYSSDVND